MSERKAPGVRDLKRDREAMKAIRYLRKKYSVGAVIAVYVCPELDKVRAAAKEKG